MSGTPVWIPADPRTSFITAAAGAGAYLYLPGPPQPETDGRGAASLHLWPLGERSILQFGARWSLSRNEEQELRQRLGAEDARRGEVKRQVPRALRLQPLPVRVLGARLELWPGIPAAEAQSQTGQGPGPHRGNPEAPEAAQVLAESSTSQAPPYNALFNLQLEGESLQAVEAALRGEAGRLKLRYQAELLAPVSVSVELVPAGRGGGQWPKTAAELEQVLERRSLGLRWSLPSGLSLALRLELGSLALERLGATLQQPGSQTRQAGAPLGAMLTAELSLPSGTALEPVADLADWVEKPPTQ
jgi:hypothetical protein